MPPVSELTVDGESAIMPIACEANLPTLLRGKSSWLTHSSNYLVWEFKNIGIPRFIESFNTCSVQNLQEIVDFNERNKEKAMPPR